MPEARAQHLGALCWCSAMVFNKIHGVDLRDRALNMPACCSPAAGLCCIHYPAGRLLCQQTALGPDRCIGHQRMPPVTCLLDPTVAVQIVPEDGKAAVLSVDVALLGLAGAVAPFVGTSLYSTVGFIVFSGVGGLLITVMLLLVHTGILAC